MNNFKSIGIFMSIMLVFACADQENNLTSVSSPDGNITIQFMLNNTNSPLYSVTFRGDTVIDSSTMGFSFEKSEPLNKDFQIIKSMNTSFDETWEMPWGEQLFVENNYNELRIELLEKSGLGRLLNVVFRAYDDGIGFRYEFPEQKNFIEALITEEHTQFNLTEDYKTFWNPGDWDIYEHLYSTTKLSEINALSYVNHPSLAQTYIPANAVNTPVTMVGKNGLHLSIHEAALVDYSGMTLKVDTGNLSFESALVGSENTNYKVKRSLPFKTPWRSVQITEDAPALIESNLIVNLNEPNKLGDVSWFEPMKYTGVWWEMHLGKSTWDYGMTQSMNTWKDTGEAHGNHGATTANVKRFIDFSAKNNINGVLVEGWNTGWERWIGFEDREGVFDFITPYPDYNLEEVTSYAKQKGVSIIMHHETSAATETYTKQQDTAFALMQYYGMHVVKTGYVGKILPKGEYHHGQYMVNHYNNTVEKAAKYEVAINAHEPIKATGLRRTFPNTISREGLRGQEFNAWASDGGNPPEHLSIVAFTRMLAGPIDYTPGIFDIKFDAYKKENQVNTTLAHQLALYVVIYSPVQMAADLVENYEANPEPLKFIRDVGVDWEITKVLNGAVGDYVTIARKERQSGNWFLGSITDEHERAVEIVFDFLDEGVTYNAMVFKDTSESHWDKNPTAIAIETMTITKNDAMSLQLAAGGGTAISLIKQH